MNTNTEVLRLLQNGEVCEVTDNELKEFLDKIVTPTAERTAVGTYFAVAGYNVASDTAPDLFALLCHKVDEDIVRVHEVLRSDSMEDLDRRIREALPKLAGTAGEVRVHMDLDGIVQ